MNAPTGYRGDAPVVAQREACRAVGMTLRDYAALLRAAGGQGHHG